MRGSATDHFARSSIGDPIPLAPFAEKALAWLAEAQAHNGGWGSGSHARQDIKDPSLVQVDLATTAFSAMALVRAGSTLKQGPYKANVRRALDYVLSEVESAPDGDAPITYLQGTQPQSKLGRQIDASMAAQFLTRMLHETRYDRALNKRVGLALEKCLRKLRATQQADGSWNDGGWAPVLQSAMANSAFEMAADAGHAVDEEVIARSRAYQAQNVDRDGSVRTEAAAGIGLYAIASSQRSVAGDVRRIQDRVASAKESGVLAPSAEVNEKTLLSIGYTPGEARQSMDAYARYERASELLSSEDVLAGFGNNGGEEFLSYMMTAESMAAVGGQQWLSWHARMSNRLSRVQNGNGSWSGHHCITSPVFSTAAVLLTLTADREGSRR